MIAINNISLTLKLSFAAQRLLNFVSMSALHHGPKGSLVLISNVPADSIFSGGAIIRKILSILPENLPIKWFYTVTKPEQAQYLEPLISRGIKLYPKPNAVYQQPLADLVHKYVRKSIGWRMRVNGQKNYIRKMAIEWAAEIRAELTPEDVVWIVMQNETVPMASELFKTVNNRLHLTFHDDCRFDFFAPDDYGVNTEQIRFVCSKATSADVIGQTLQAEYKKQFGLESLIFRRGFVPNTIEARRPALKNEYHLLFIGSSHSDKSWQIAIERMSRLSGKSFVIHCFGHTKEWLPNIVNWVAANGFDNIKLIDEGVLPEAQVIARKAEFDFGLFMWDYFDFKAAWMKFSVSTKLTTYLGAGLPMLALVNVENEAMSLFDVGVAYNLDAAHPDSFEAFVTGHDMQAKFDHYIEHYFNETRFNADFLDAAALKGLIEAYS